MRETFIAILTALFINTAIDAQPAPNPADSSEAKARQPQGQVESLRNLILVAESRIDFDTIDKAGKGLREQRDQLLLEEAGARGRRRGIEEAIEKYTRMTQRRADADPVVGELEKVISFREQELRRMEQLQKAAAISPSEVNGAETELAKSRVALAEAKQRAAGGPAANDALDAWDRELINLSIEAEDRQARLDYIAARLKMLDKLTNERGALGDQFNSLNPHSADFGRLGLKQNEIKKLIEQFEADYEALGSLPSTSPATHPTGASASHAN
jgi:hypothetical protein